MPAVEAYMLRMRWEQAVEKYCMQKSFCMKMQVERSWRSERNLGNWNNAVLEQSQCSPYEEGWFVGQMG